jgi:hypothetical protein
LQKSRASAGDGEPGKKQVFRVEFGNFTGFLPLFEALNDVETKRLTLFFLLSRLR